MSSRKYLTTKQLTEILEDSEFWEDIEDVDDIDVAIIPPEPDELTDTENFEENSLEEEEVEDVAGTLELFVPILEQDETELSSDDEPLAIKKRKLCKVTNHLPRSDDTSVNCSSIPELNNKFERSYSETVPRTPKWTQNHIQYSEMNCLSEDNFENVTCQLYGKMAVEIFEEFFSQDIVDRS